MKRKKHLCVIGLGQFGMELARELARAGVDYSPAPVDVPLDRALHEYLARREALARVR